MSDEGGSPGRADAIESYVDRACGHLGLAPTLKEHVRDEIRGHIVEATEAHVARGVPREEAVQRAIEEFGDPGEVAEGCEGTCSTLRREPLTGCGGQMRYGTGCSPPGAATERNPSGGFEVGSRFRLVYNPAPCSDLLYQAVSQEAKGFP